MSHKVLIVDDETDILEFVGYNLRKEGYTVFTASNGRDAIRTALNVEPNLILMDVMMPDMDGMEATREIRSHEQMQRTIIAYLTARHEDYSQIAGFESGADDYITKPIRVKVLMSRIKALLKRQEWLSEAKESDDAERPILIDRERHLVIKEGESINLPRKEFELLALLYSRPQKVFTRDEIFANVWGTDVIVGDRTIDVHIRKLREKIGDEFIVTIKGVGYKYDEPPVLAEE
ncbi:response regulator transcription factor [Alistipes sp. OttesenSCG-928-L06]|nr:response regulator transcription factor [Alistipes sp. OttesenSCG-928-L06]